MALKVNVLVHGIDNLHTARYCAGMGVEIGCFPISPDLKGFLVPSQFQQIKSWIEGLRFFGEITALEGIDAYQVDGYLTTKEHLLPMLERRGKPIIFKIEQNNNNFETLSAIFLKTEAWTEAFLLKIAPSHIQQYHEHLKKLAENYRIFLETDFSQLLPEQLLKTLPLKGIALTAVSEVKTGIADFAEIATILETLED